MRKRSSFRPAIIFASEESSWQSCKSIVRNLLAAYERLPEMAGGRRFQFNDDMGAVRETALRIFEFAPDRLVFVDHWPHPHLLIRALAALYGRRALPPIYFHVYGDFTLYAREWLSIEPILKKTKVRFICASRRQRALVRSFCARSPEAAFRVCHFPVDRAQFGSKPAARTEWRARHGIRSDETVVSYSGRMSLQKNVWELTQEVYEAWSQGNRNLRLVLAGGFDNLGAPFFGIELSPGAYYHYWRTRLNRLPAEFRSRVHFLGHCSLSELDGVYNATDVFASLSLHHDEDFGMAPAEALASGSVAVLSSWGGYASFKLSPASCQLVPVKIGEGVLVYSSAAFQTGLDRLSRAPQDDLARAARSSRFLDVFSIEAASAILSSVHIEKLGFNFKGFSWIMRKQGRQEPIRFSEGMRKGTFYAEIYKHYAQETRR
ncbi:MAG TPA: glycosyltransferase family 4 protein [Bdellovibrionales bacterium]|nr:glycosyltransferase family 4 protein [Bdellovibrionales bacterium]